MEQQDRVKRYAQSLEKNLQNAHHSLKKTAEDFQEMCLIVKPEKNVPRDIIIDIRQTYKEIRERLIEVKAIQELLKGKYRQYVRPNPTRDKEVAELGFLAKTSYSKFEYTIMQIQAREKAKVIEKGKDHTVKTKQVGPFQWFQSKENQTIFLEGLRMLKEAYPEASTSLGDGERRDGTQNRLTGGPSLTLFVFKGESQSLDELQPQIQLRERDIIERYSKDELRGVLLHMREIDPSEIESILQRFMKSDRFSNLKCLLLRVQSLEPLGSHLVDSVEKTLGEMAEGQTKTLSI